MRKEAASSSIRLEALDKGMTPLEGGNNIAEADFMRRPRKPEAASGTALCHQKPMACQFPHHLRQVITRQREFGRNLVNRVKTVFPAGQFHEGAQPEIREARQSHAWFSKRGIYNAALAAVNRHCKYRIGDRHGTEPSHPSRHACR